MAGSSWATPSSNGRIANASGSWQDSCDNDITGWALSDEFIVALWAQCGDHSGCASSFTIQWRNLTDGGSWTDLASGSGELRQGTGTSLVNGNTVASSSGCNTSTDSEEVEGDNTTDTLTVTAKDQFIEVQVAVDPSNALNSKEYEFRLYDNAASAALTEISSSLTTEAAAIEVPVNLQSIVITQLAQTEKITVPVSLQSIQIALLTPTLKLKQSVSLQSIQVELLTPGIEEEVSVGLQDINIDPLAVTTKQFLGVDVPLQSIQISLLTPTFKMVQSVGLQNIQIDPLQVKAGTSVTVGLQQINISLLTPTLKEKISLSLESINITLLDPTPKITVPVSLQGINIQQLIPSIEHGLNAGLQQIQIQLQSITVKESLSLSLQSIEIGLLTPSFKIGVNASQQSVVINQYAVTPIIGGGLVVEMLSIKVQQLNPKIIQSLSVPLLGIEINPLDITTFIPTLIEVITRKSIITRSITGKSRIIRELTKGSKITKSITGKSKI